MKRLLLPLIAGLGALAVVPNTLEAQKPMPKKESLPKSNQVYVKIILPTDPPTGLKDRLIVETWIASQLKERGQTKFTAATGWIPLVEKCLEPTSLWDGRLGNKTWGCPVDVDITDRMNGRIKIIFDGWRPVNTRLTVSLQDEAGSQAIAPVEQFKTDLGMPFVAVLIGPRPENFGASTVHKK